MKFLILHVFISILSLSAQGQTYSAARPLGERSSSKIDTLKNKLRETQGFASQDTVVNVAKNLDKTSFVKVTQWTSYEELESRFKKLRDERFIHDPEKEDLLRRESWMFPDDGCYARASLMNDNLIKWTSEPVSKIFVFGDLMVKTDNSEYGYVGWWFHVAPIVRVDDEKYIIDPAVEPERPLKLVEWLERMGDKSEMKIAICNPFAYTPESLCVSAPESDDDIAMADQLMFLPLERERLISLGRNPDLELGERPPWLNATTTDHSR